MTDTRGPSDKTITIGRSEDTVAAGTRAATHSLLIWEEIPETTKLVLIPNDVLTDDDRAVLRAAHGHLINTEVPPAAEAALNKLNYALMINHTCDDKTCPTGWTERFAGYVIDASEEPIEGKIITAVYWSGLVL